MVRPAPAPRNLRQKKARARNSRSASTESTAPHLSLQAYVSNIFFGIFIQDDDEISELVFERNWSRHVLESDNGMPLNFDQFGNFVTETRERFNNRQLISQSFVIVPADASGESGEVAHTSHFSALQQGKEVTGTIVSLLNIRLERGLRKVVTENFILALDS